MNKKIMSLLAAGAVMALGAASCGNKTATPPADTMRADSVIEETVAVDTMNAQGDTLQEVVTETVEEVPAQEVAKVEKNAKNDGYKTTASGLKYKVIKEGKGKSPKATDVVLVNYEGKLLDGTIFDSSYQRGEPISFPLNRVIAGWTEGLQLMKEGGTYEFLIPYNLAYGEQGAPPVIPPKADLIFKVDLIEVK